MGLITTIKPKLQMKMSIKLPTQDGQGDLDSKIIRIQLKTNYHQHVVWQGVIVVVVLSIPAQVKFNHTRHVSIIRMYSSVRKQNK